MASLFNAIAKAGDFLDALDQNGDLGDIKKRVPVVENVQASAERHDSSDSDVPVLHTHSASHQKLIGRVSELEEENERLREVWNDTRDKLKKMRGVLNKKMGGQKEVLLARKNEFQLELQEQDTAHQLALQEVQQQQHSAQLAHKVELQNQEAMMAATRSELKTTKELVRSFESKLQTLTEVKEELLALQDTQQGQHQQILGQLRLEQEQRLDQLAEEKSVHATSLQELHSRETSLEDDNVGFVKELAAAHRELEGKSRELSRSIAAKQWLEADQKALQEQIESLKTRLQIETQQSTETCKTYREQAKHAMARLAEQESLVLEKDQLLVSTQAEVQALQAGKQRASLELDARYNTVQRQISSMTTLMLEKQARLEHVNMEKSSLELQLEQSEEELKRMQVKYTQARRELELERPQLDLETGLQKVSGGGLKLRKGTAHAQTSLHVGNREIKSKSVVKAVNFLDSLGSKISSVVRRNPTIRLLFALYFVLFHVWVFYVMYHFATESPEQHSLAP